ncbi:MAG: hypothetical protein HYX68_00815 [Planctomycetes bacterium]|nr:hypothetical protein [Planctomycetota bacterium]
MQIDPAVELVLSVVESHHGLLGLGGLDPAHIWDENSSLGVSIPYTNLGQVSAHPNEAMNSINVDWLTNALRRHHFRAVVGVHGLSFRPPHRSYLRDRLVQHFAAGSVMDCHVDELGSGTIAFHSQLVSFHPRKWRHHTMTDLMVAIEAMQQGVPRISVRRPAKFLRPLEEGQPDSLWQALQRDETRETAIMHAALAAFSPLWQNCDGVAHRKSSRQALGFIE